MQTNNPYIDYQPCINAEGKQKLTEMLSDADSSVYAFNEGFPLTSAAAAFARLSHTPDDLKVLLLNEFAKEGSEGREQLNRVVNQTDDETVSQLAGLHLVVENASTILANLIGRGRLASYREQSARFGNFEQRNLRGHYKYHMPNLPDSLANQYRTTMNSLFESYGIILRGITDYVRARYPQGDQETEVWQQGTKSRAVDALLNMLPAAASTTVGVFGSAHAIENMIMNLLANPLPEAVSTGRYLLKAARAVAPEFFHLTDEPETGGANTTYQSATKKRMRHLAHELVLPEAAAVGESVRLLDAWPLQERDVAAGLLFESCNTSYNELQRQSENWDDTTIRSIFDNYFGERLNRHDRPGRALEEVHYVWEIVSDFRTFRHLQRHRMVDAWEWQALSPNYGYDVPDLVRESGFEQPYMDAFSRSEQLYGRMVEAGFSVQAQYATLQGHRMRYRFITNVREALHMTELRTTDQAYPQCYEICRRMHDHIQRVHPIIGGHMRFVGRRQV